MDDDETLRAVRSRVPRRIEPTSGLAAVAMVFVRPPRGGDELLLIRRSEHPNDPWSGHVALPGGRVEETDASALAA
ncbi:MAG: NUDIX domain-containing protein, partial [Myxococcota bacterium]